MADKKMAPQPAGCPQKTFSVCHNSIPRWLCFLCAGFFIVAGIAVFVVGVIITGGVDAAVKATVEEAVIVSSTSDDNFQNLAVTNVGTTWGGTATDDEDDGAALLVAIPNITNAHAVLTLGARPAIEDVTYQVRRYTYRHNTTLSGSTLAYHQQTVDIPANAAEEARMQSDVVYTPNLAYFGVIGLLDAANLGATLAADPVIMEAPLQFFEDLAGPAFTAPALTLLLPQVQSYVRGAVWSLYWGAQYGGLAAANPAFAATVAQEMAGAVTPAAFSASQGFDFAVSNDTVMITYIDGVTTANIGTVRPTAGEASFLMPLVADTTFGAAIAGLVPLSPLLASSTIMATSSLWPTVLGAVNATYTANGINADATRLAQHTAWLVLWSWQSVDPAATFPAQADGWSAVMPAFINSLTGYTNCAGCCVNMGGSGPNGTLVDADEAVGVQMGTNNLVNVVTNLVVSAGGGTSCSAANAPTLTQNLQYLVAENSGLGCRAGESLVDIVNDPSILPTAPELSCFSNRPSSPLDAALGRFPGATRIPGGKMSMLLKNVTSGPGLLGAVGAAALGAELPAGSNNIKQFLNAARKMLATYPGLQAHRATLWGLAVARNAAVQAVSSSTTTTTAGGMGVVALGNEIDSILASTAAWQTACRAELAGRDLPQLDCFQLLDVADWLDHIARNWVYYPTMVWNYGGGSVPGGNQNGVDLTNLATGPIIRQTSFEAMFTGALDSYLLALTRNPASSRGPAVLTAEEPVATFLAGLTDAVKTTVNTGADNIADINTMITYKGQASVSHWAATVATPTATTPITGNRNGGQFEPTFDVLATIDDAPLLREVFQSTILRFVNLYLEGETKGPAGKLDLWRYTLGNATAMAAAGVDTTVSGLVQASAVDAAYGQPGCMIAAKPILPSATGSPPSIDLYVSTPHYSICGQEVVGTPSGVRWDERDEFKSVVDVEPVSGAAVNAQLQVGAYIQFRNSTWYPGFPTTSAAGVHFYQPVFWSSGGASIEADDEETLANAYSEAAAAKTDLPPTLYGVGAVVLIIGLLFAFIAASYPKGGAVGGTSSGAGMVDDSNPLASGGP